MNMKYKSEVEITKFERMFETEVRKIIYTTTAIVLSVLAMLSGCGTGLKQASAPPVEDAGISSSIGAAQAAEILQ